MDFKFSYKLLSHPPNGLLIDHLEEVGRFSREAVSSAYIDDREIFSNISYLIGVTHDFGKGTVYFQQWLREGERTNKANHSLLSSLFSYFVISIFLKQQKKLEQFKKYLPIAWIVVKRHHGNIGNIDVQDGCEIAALNGENEKRILRKQAQNIKENNLQELREIYNKLFFNLNLSINIEIFIDLILDEKSFEFFLKEIKMSLLLLSREDNSDNYFLTLYLYSVLLDADKLHASGAGVPKRFFSIPQNIIDNYKKTKIFVTDIPSANPINNLREEAYCQVLESIKKNDLEEEKILSITLPTGCGKTLTVLATALKLRERIKSKYDFYPRIIYSLPFLSIIDQNASVIEEIFTSNGYDIIPSNLFLKHHHLSSSEYKEYGQGNSELDDLKNINQSILLTEGWHSEIIITTFNQLLNSIVTNQNKLARKFHNIANSVIILDEIQALPVKYYSLIRETLNYLAKNFNCWIIAMSATQPIIFGSGAKELTGEPKKFFENFDRFDFRFDMVGEKYDYLFKKIFNDIIYGDFHKKDIIIILNTVSICKKFYNDLKEKISQTLNKKGIIDLEGIYNIGDLEIINLSTSILPIYRLAKIKRIREDKKRKIIVTTQLVEAGVDISADVIYRDLAPLDCLIQSAGRCNRNNKQKKGVVNVFVMTNDNDKNYYSFIYDPVLMGITREIIGNKKEVSEKDFSLEIINNYYDKVIQRMDTETDGKKIFDDMKNLKFQKTRDFELIKNQKTMSIFVEIDQKAKKNRENLEKILNLKNGIDKKNELLTIKQVINQYTLSVNFTYNLRSLQCLPSIGNLEKEDFKYIPLENLDDWYKKDSGLDLKLENKTDNVIF